MSNPSIAENVAPRIGRVRISPHVYNDEEDIDRFVASFRRLACA
jgi:selenocysteine lyase/cysteine desulfurase